MLFFFLGPIMKHVYLENGLMRLAHQVFEEMPSPDVVSLKRLQSLVMLRKGLVWKQCDCFMKWWV